VIIIYSLFLWAAKNCRVSSSPSRLVNWGDVIWQNASQFYCAYLAVSQSFFLLFLFAAVASDLAVRLLFDPGQNQKGIPRPAETSVATISASTKTAKTSLDWQDGMRHL
jgi:hypothetical protein